MPPTPTPATVSGVPLNATATGAPRNISTGSRPYRSHKVRACDLCRKRKSRCTVDLPGQSCLLCRIQGAECHYREDLASPRGSTLGVARLSNDHDANKYHPPMPDRDRDRDSAADAVQPGSGRKRKYDQLAPAANTTNTSSTSTTTTGPGSGPGPGQAATPIKTIAPQDVTGTPAASVGDMPRTSSAAREKSQNADNDRPGLGESLNESVHIVGPVTAEDAQVIEKFMPSKRKSPESNLPYNVYSSDPRNPILYTTVSRRRQGLRATGTPGESQLEILEQILGPFKHDLVDMCV